MATYVVNKEKKKQFQIHKEQKTEHHRYVLYKNKTWNEIHNIIIHVPKALVLTMEENIYFR